MIDPQLKPLSKFLSLVLRHQPEKIGLKLDGEGWADIDELVQLAGKHGKRLSAELIQQIVSTNDKQRFAISTDRKRIRASQGHSVKIDLGIPPTQPPDLLFHGTATRFLDSIKQSGLHAGSRQHVHLSSDEETATRVGSRHGKPVIIRVKSGLMHQAGIAFYLSENGVWLTDQVPVEYLEF
jgi:putative RNA 2'-phosphotransferase